MPTLICFHENNVVGRRQRESLEVQRLLHSWWDYSSIPRRQCQRRLLRDIATVSSLSGSFSDGCPGIKSRTAFSAWSTTVSSTQGRIHGGCCVALGSAGCCDSTILHNQDEDWVNNQRQNFKHPDGSIVSHPRTLW